MRWPAEELFSLREHVLASDAAVVGHLGQEVRVIPGSGPSRERSKRRDELDAAALRRLDVRRPFGEADERDQISEVVLEVGRADLEDLAEKRLIDVDLPAFGLLGLDVRVARNTEATELGEEARLLDAGAPGAAQACRGDRGDERYTHARSELLAKRVGIVVASAGRDEHVLTPCELKLRVCRHRVAALIHPTRRAKHAHGVTALLEPFALEAGTDDDDG